MQRPGSVLLLATPRDAAAGQVVVSSTGPPPISLMYAHAATGAPQHCALTRLRQYAEPARPRRGGWGRVGRSSSPITGTCGSSIRTYGGGPRSGFTLGLVWSGSHLCCGRDWLDLDEGSAMDGRRGDGWARAIAPPRSSGTIVAFLVAFTGRPYRPAASEDCPPNRPASRSWVILGVSVIVR
jgi:hypothetical protein